MSPLEDEEDGEMSDSDDDNEELKEASDDGIVNQPKELLISAVESEMSPPPILVPRRMKSKDIPADSSVGVNAEKV